MNAKRTLRWGAGFTVVIALGLYAELVRETSAHDPSYLLSCMEAKESLTSWTCKQVLLHDSFSPAQVAALNRQGGALYPAVSDDPAVADEILALFLSRGVDINAGDERNRNWTALHSLAMEADPDRVKMLLRHGARMDVRDSDGKTPLDIARQLAAEHPDQPRRAEVLQALEEAGRNQPAGAGQGVR